MKTIVTFCLLSLFLLAGCATTMSISDASFHRTKSPVGIFLCASTQITDSMSENQRNYIISSGYSTLSKTMENQGFSTKLLNETVPYEKAFQKYLGSFNIDEKVIAKYAKESGCEFFLIVYYDVTNVNIAVPVPIPLLGTNLVLVNMVYINGNPVQETDSGKVYSNVSLYGWMVKSDGASIISNSHLPLASFQDYVNKNGFQARTVNENYLGFFSFITLRMFQKL